MQKLLIGLFVLKCLLCGQAYATSISVVALGANGQDQKDDTGPIQQAISNYDTIYIPKGVYLITTIRIGDNKVVQTDGFSTKLQQLPNNIGKQIIRIEGSNVSLDPMSFEGNIATDTSEFNYAVFVVPPLDKNTRNIVVKGVNARNLRGDAVSIGNSGSTYPEHVLVENVTVQNCFRNGISVVGGKDIIIRNVDVWYSGMLGIDVEAEGGEDVVVEDIVIENVKAGNVCVSGREKRVKRVVCRNLELDGQRQLSTPRYKPMQNAGIIIYNTEDVQFQNVTITNMPGFAVFAGDIYDKYEILSDRIRFANLSISQSALSDKVYNAYICVMGVKSLQINGLNAALKSDQVLLLGKANTTPLSQMVSIKKGSISNGLLIAKNCFFNGEDLAITQFASLFECMNGIALNRCQVVGKATQPHGTTIAGGCTHTGAKGSFKIANSTYNKKPLKVTTSSRQAWLK